MNENLKTQIFLPDTPFFSSHDDAFAVSKIL